ncbi:MAG: LD-carboxypeptidase [Cryomorphaceae bacterium]|nr:MAG: LD-carboxypeptidase [Cryomorphaceae bacterium]
MRKPPPLTAGDEIRVLSTARKITPQEVEPAVQILESWGFRVSLGKHLYAEERQFAGTDIQRRADLQQALNDPQVKAILCARGGYGTARLLDELDFTHFHNTPCWLAGYSDVTALHNHLHRHLGICSLHSTMPVNFPTNTPEALESLRLALTGQNLEYSTEPHPLQRVGECSGQLTGGNLSMLYSLMGSPSQVDAAGKILFLEDLDEYLYHVDRMMLNLLRSGVLGNLAGLVVGGMTDMNDNAVPFGRTAEEIVREAIEPFDYPVCFGFPAGHIKDNRTLVLGQKTKLTVGESGVSLVQIL